ncbi:MAG: hypothetical protein JEZ03_06405 [Bacteroidales bacterium]|nr:hypothetical protein [Bacteroidales bacterium]
MGKGTRKTRIEKGQSRLQAFTYLEVIIVMMLLSLLSILVILSIIHMNRTLRQIAKQNIVYNNRVFIRKVLDHELFNRQLLNVDQDQLEIGEMNISCFGSGMILSNTVAIDSLELFPAYTNYNINVRQMNQVKVVEMNFKAEHKKQTISKSIMLDAKYYMDVKTASVRRN